MKNTRYALLDAITSAAVQIESFDPSTGATYGFVSSRMSFGKSTEICHDGSLIISDFMHYDGYGFAIELRFRGIRIGSVWVNYDITEEELFQMSTIEDIGTVTYDDIQYAHMKYMNLCRLAKTKASLSRDIYNNKLNGSSPSVLGVYQKELFLNSMMDKPSMDRFVRQINGIATPSKITKNSGI